MGADAVPELSVVIASSGREPELRACLEALGAQTAPAFDVVVVVQQASDAQALLERIRPPFEVRIVAGDAAVSSAWKLGASEATGRRCLFLDEGVVPGADVASEHVRIGGDRPDAVAAGPVELVAVRDVDGLARALARSRNERMHALVDGRAVAAYRDCAAGNVSAPREALLAAAEKLPAADPIALAWLAAPTGAPLVFLPRATARREIRLGFQAAAAELQRRGAADAALYRGHAPLLTHLELSTFAETRRTQRLPLRALLALRPGPRPLEAVSRLAARAGGADAWYGVLVAYFYWRGARGAGIDGDTWRRLTRGTAILMYHALGERGERPTRFVVPAERFRRQMAWLARRHHVLALGEFLRRRETGELPPPRSVVITFDDAYADNHRIAYPILTSYGLPASIFVVTRALGQQASWRAAPELAGREIMTREAMAEMTANVSFGSHTRTHPSLPSLSEAAARDEIEGSRHDLEEELGRPVECFAYPFGHVDEAVAAIVRAAGYKGACGVEPGHAGPGTPAHELRRHEIRGTDSLLRFAATVLLGDTRLLERRRRRRGR